MQRSNKELLQERAVLGARLGDPDGPLGGTLLARQRRLQSDLERILSLREAVEQNRVSTISRIPAAGSSSRSQAAVERELRLVEAELSASQRRIAEIDKMLARRPDKSRK